MGRHDEAVTEIKKALELDPNSVPTGFAVGMILYFARQYDQAIQHLQKMIEAHPNYAMSHHYLSLVFLQKGMFAEAIVEAEKGVELSDRSGWLAYAYAVAGRKDEARRILQDLEREQVHKGWIAAVYTALGDKIRRLTGGTRPMTRTMGGSFSSRTRFGILYETTLASNNCCGV